MTKAVVQETFATGSNPVSGNNSDVVFIPTGTTAMKLTTSGLDVNNTIKTQKTTSPGGPWVDQVTYSADQAATSIAVVAGEQWRVVGVTQQALKDIRYKLSCES